MQLNFNESEKVRMDLTKTQRRKIRALYKDLYKKINKLVYNLRGYPKIGYMSEIGALNNLKNQILMEYENLGGNVKNIIKQNMENISKQVISQTGRFAEGLGFSVSFGYYELYKDIVERIITGKIYQNNWTLSKAIWKEGQKVAKDINTIIAEGVALNKNSYDIAKDLEKYVNPDARKDWEWSKIYPKTNKKIDYNAQRLARTMVSHAYEQSIINSTKYNPFIKGLKWLTSNSHRVCEICMERDGKIYKPEELPLDHPNGMCTFEPVIEDNMMEVSNRIADWANGKEDKELDEYAKSLKI